MPWRKKAPGRNETIFELINAYRRSRGKRELWRSDTICRMTEIRLAEIARDYSHDGFRAVIRGHLGSFGENIARGYRTPKDALNGWIRSRGHDRNLLGDWNEGCARGDGDRWVFIARKRS
jgi:uncharacterized protein YkwD